MIKFTISFFFLCLNFIAFSQNQENNYSIVNPTFLDSSIANYNLFLSSELHWNKNNLERRKMIIKYLVNQKSLNTILLEDSYAFSYWINLYIKMGNENLLKELLSHYYYADYYYKDIKGGNEKRTQYVNSFQYYVWLREFLTTKKLNIETKGIDLEYIDKPKPIIWSFLKYINLLEKNDTLKVLLADEIKEAEKLFNTQGIKISDFKKWFNHLDNNVKNKGIKDDFLVNYVFNITQSIPFARGSKMNYREEELFKNFNKYISLNEKVYGQFGLPHITLSNGKRTALQSFAFKLNQNKIYQGKILSIGLVCYECKMAEYPSRDYYQPFLTKGEFERLSPEFKKLPSNTFVDLRKTDEKIKEYVQLLLVVHD